MTAKDTTRRTKSWMALTVTVAFGLVIGMGTPFEGHAATGQLKKQCKKACKTQKKDCLRAFKTQFKTAKLECKALASKQEKKECKKAAKAAKKTNKKACVAGFKTDCKQCCSAEDDITLCNVAVCGDGELRQPQEQCDDGNQEDGDGCSSACFAEAEFMGGARTFSLGAASGFFSSQTGTDLELGKPQGTFPLVAEPPDQNGISRVTATGPFFLTLDIEAPVPPNLRVCTRIDSCEGFLDCTGTSNVDTVVELNSVFGSTGQGDNCDRIGGDCDGVANGCCNNACEGFEMGVCTNSPTTICSDDTACSGGTCTENSGNDFVNMIGVNATPSGPGALALTCMQTGMEFDRDADPDLDCTTATLTDPIEPNVYTTGTITARVINHCSGPGAPAETIPEFTLTGTNFSCGTWTSENSAGALVYAIPSEEPTGVMLFAGDGASAGRYAD